MDYYATLLVGFSGADIVTGVAVGVESVGGGRVRREERTRRGVEKCMVDGVEEGVCLGKAMLWGLK